MGKGKGKKGRREAKIAAKKATEGPKISGVPKAGNPIKKAKKLASREKKSSMNTNPPGPEKFPIPMGRPKPFTKSPQHAKWPALFKKHLGVIEAHIRSLDRVMQSMKAQMGEMEDKERMEWELGERGNWRVICNMMDRAREVLAGAREAAKGILPSRSLRDKKGLGVVGTNFEPLGPKLAERAAELGYKKRGGLGRDPDAVSTDSDGDTEMSGSSNSSDAGDAVAEGVDFVPLSIGKKVPRFSTADNSGEDKENKVAASGVEPNPYFVVDTEPTPVVLDGNGVMKSKKRAKEGDGEGKRAKRAKKEKSAVTESAEYAPVPQPVQPAVDFTALEANLQAEIEARSKAQESQATESTDEKKSKKKRRRSSGGVEEVVEKKVKKEKSKIKVEDVPAENVLEATAEEKVTKDSGKNRKLEETVAREDAPNDVAKKEIKKEKREKKRKADSSADGADVDESKKKKRKHKVGSDSE